MPLIALNFATCVLAAFLCILLPGWGAKQILSRAGLAWKDEQSASFLTIFALGVHVSAIAFLVCWACVSPYGAKRIAVTVIVVDVIIAVVGFLCARKWSTPKFDVRVTGAVIVGTLVGIYALIQFPTTLDSVQALEVQQFILAWDGGFIATHSWLTGLWRLLWGGLTVPAQAGFGGISFVPALLRHEVPVVNVISANKIVLFPLAAVTSLFMARQFNLRPLAIGAGLVFVNMLFSQFGLYGMFDTGKDSIFAVVMAMASLAALVDAGDSDHESGLYMSAAILLGAVAVPYLMLFWALWFAFSGGSIIRRAVRQAQWCLYPLVLGVVGVHAAFASPGSIHFGILPALVVGLVVIAAAARLQPAIVARACQFGERTLWLFSLVPLLLIVAIVLLMPAKAEIIANYENNVPISFIHPPLDGIVTARFFLFNEYPTNNPLLSALAVLGLCFAPLLSKRFRTPFYIALFACFPGVVCLALVHIKLGLHILPPFNLWDMTRDTVQWYVGAAGVVFSVALLSVLLERVCVKRFSMVAAPAMAALFVIGAYSSYPHHAFKHRRPVIYTDIGGYTERPAALAMAYVWDHAKDGYLYVSADSAFDPQFYSYPMYGARRVLHFDPTYLGKESTQHMLLDSGDLGTVVAYARQNQIGGRFDSIGGDSYIGFLTNSTRDLALNDVPDFSFSETGMYAQEASSGVTFRWVGQDSTVSVSNLAVAAGKACVELKFVNAWGVEDQVRISSRAGDETVDLPASATRDHPKSAEVCVDTAAGPAQLKLHSVAAAKTFKSDPRTVSFGILWPLG